MKFELDETTLLRVSGAAALVCGVAAAASPKPFHDLYHSSTAVYSEPTTRWSGITASWLGSEQLVMSVSDYSTKETKKDMLKVAGLGWLACAAHHAYNVQNNTQLRDISTASAVGMGVLGGLCLWKGYENPYKVD